ncbi:MAG: trypsin-like peptidase domain-containing protein [Sedimentisphaerales bacterium]|nr:trypsin-like peptidase domain-containing protein [Sedimentisphaerales bacterium]
MKIKLVYIMTAMVFTLFLSTRLTADDSKSNVIPITKITTPEPNDLFRDLLLKAEAGNAKAQFNLGWMYDTGRGVPQDYNEAIKWYTKVAEQGDASAQCNLGNKYWNGQGVPEDYVEAYKWLNLSAAQGHELATKKREILRGSMSPSQIAEAQRLSREFKPKTQDSSTADPQLSGKTEIKGNGTGFFITSDGYLLTAYHVIKDASKIQIWMGKRLSPAKVIRIDSANDIALLKVDGVALEALAVQSSREVKVGQEIFTLGFPNIQFQGLEAKYTQGNISSLTGIADDPRLFQISAAVQPGNSGGPLLNTEGQVVGLIVAKLDEIAAAKETGSLPQNVNYALKSSFILSFLESLPEVSSTLLQPKKSGLTRTEIVEKTNKAVVMVLCY